MDLATPPLTTPPLNSERIEARYGNYGVRILRQTAASRESCLFSQSGDQTTCRTLAIVRFANPVSQELAGPLKRVRDGASLGATLADTGWTVVKINRHIGTHTLTNASEANVVDLLRIEAPAKVAVHIYDLWARRSDQPNGLMHVVATLLELHHPDYLSAALLRDYYAQLRAEPLDSAVLQAWLDRIPAISTPERFD